MRKRNTAGMRWLKTREWSAPAPSPAVPGVSGDPFGRTLQGCGREVGSIQTKRAQNAEKAGGAHLEDLTTQL